MPSSKKRSKKIPKPNAISSLLKGLQSEDKSVLSTTLSKISDERKIINTVTYLPYDKFKPFIEELKSQLYDTDKIATQACKWLKYFVEAHFEYLHGTPDLSEILTGPMYTVLQRRMANSQARHRHYGRLELIVTQLEARDRVKNDDDDDDHVLICNSHLMGSESNFDELDMDLPSDSDDESDHQWMEEEEEVNGAVGTGSSSSDDEDMEVEMSGIVENGHASDSSSSGDEESD